MCEDVTVRNLSLVPLKLTQIDYHTPYDPLEGITRSWLDRIRDLFSYLTGHAKTKDANNGEGLANTATYFRQAKTVNVEIDLKPLQATKVTLDLERDQSACLTIRNHGDEEWRYHLGMPSERAPSAVTAHQSLDDGFTTMYIHRSSILAVIDHRNMSDWMRPFPDSTPISALSKLPNRTPATQADRQWLLGIPGTHNSPTCYPALPSVRCQAASIQDQLENGVRFLDVRVQVNESDRGADSDSLELVHAAFPIKFGGSVKLQVLLDDIYSFFEQHPSETVILSLKREGRGRGTDAIFAKRLQKHYVTPKRWYTRANIPTLGEARGKIVLLRRFALSESMRQEVRRAGGFGIDATNWADNTPNHRGGLIQIQDFYGVLATQNIEKKIQLVCAHFDRSSAVVHAFGGTERLVMDQMQPLFLNFLSASNFWKPGCWPEKIAGRVNHAVLQLLCERYGADNGEDKVSGQPVSGEGGLGVVICDWVGIDEDWDFIWTIVAMNYRLLRRLQEHIRHGQSTTGS